MAAHETGPPETAVERVTKAATSEGALAEEMTKHPDDPSITGALEPHFAPEELAQFDIEDVQAGSVIGKMLALFFFYTVVVMTIVGLWTYYSVTD